MNWIDCRERMPEEREIVDSTKKTHMESKLVLSWDSMYGPCIDWTRDGKWVSERHGGYQGQVVHGIVAWMPIPEMDIEDYKL